MLKVFILSVILLTTPAVFAQYNGAKPAATGFVPKNEKQQNKIPIKCKSDTTCIDETGVSLTGPKRVKTGTTKQ